MTRRKFPHPNGWLVVTAFASSLFVGCQSSSDTGSEPEPLPGLDEVLAHYVDDIVADDLASARRLTLTLSEKITAYEAALAENDGDVSVARSDAQQAWRVAMSQWQKVELLQVGPLGSVNVALGGESKRDEIYSFPLTSPCGVDQNIVDESFANDNFVAASTVAEYGFDATEHLLFAEGPDNACARPAAINADGTWDAIEFDEIQRRRVAYAKVTANQIVVEIDAVIAKWESGFGDAMKAGSGDNFESTRDGLNEMFAALFYIELVTKDRKLAQPVGIHLNCTEDVCPDDVELPISGSSIEALRSNISQLEVIYFGRGEGAAGFDDLVTDAGREDLNESMATAIVGAKAAFDAIDVSLKASIEQDPALALAAHDALKGVTDLIKADLVSVLNLEVPQEGAGDND